MYRISLWLAAHNAKAKWNNTAQIKRQLPWHVLQCMVHIKESREADRRWSSNLGLTLVVSNLPQKT